MTNLKGGYALIDLNSNTIFDDIAKIYHKQKVVLLYDTDGKPKFCTLSSDGGYILKSSDGGYKIESNNTITPLPSGVTKYKHTIYATLIDGCSDEYEAIIMFESEDNTPFDSETFNTLFTEEYNEGLFNIGYISHQIMYINNLYGQNGYYPIELVYNDSDMSFLASGVTISGDSLSLSSVTDIVQ